MITDLIIEHKMLFEHFLKRYKAYNIGSAKLVEEMKEDGIVMDKKRLQRFIIHGSAKRITQKAYLWLLYRHGIEVGLRVTGITQMDKENRLKAKQFANDLE